MTLWRIAQLCFGSAVFGSGVTMMSLMTGDWVSGAFMVTMVGLTLFAYGLEHALDDKKAELTDKYTILHESNTLKKFILLEKARDIAAKEERFEDAHKCQVLINRIEEVEAHEQTNGNLTIGI